MSEGRSTTGLNVDLKREVQTSSCYSIVGLNSVIHYLTLQHGVCLKDDFTTFGEKVMEDDKPRFKVLVITNLNLALSTPVEEVKNVIQETEKLFHKNFPKEGDKRNVTSLLRTTSRNDGNQYVLVCLYAYLAKKTGGVEVVGASLGAIAPKTGGYLAYLATSNGDYTKAKFGGSADKQKFAGRGIAKFVMVLFQLTSYWKSYTQECKSLFLHCEEGKVEWFQKFRFIHVENPEDKAKWPLPVIKLHRTVGIGQLDIKRFNLKAMRIDDAIDGYLQKGFKFSLSAEPATQDTAEANSSETDKAAQAIVNLALSNLVTSDKAAQALSNLGTFALSVPKKPLSEKAQGVISENKEVSGSNSLNKKQIPRKKQVAQQPQHDELSGDDSLSNALIRKVYGAFNGRSNGGLTSGVHHEIEKSFTRTLKAAEWIHVQKIIDELLENADKHRLTKFIDNKGTSLTPTFQSLLLQLHDEKLRHLENNECRDVVEEQCCGMLPNRIWLLSEHFLSGIIDSGAPGQIRDRPSTEGQSVHCRPPEDRSGDPAAPQGENVNPTAPQRERTTSGEEVVGHEFDPVALEALNKLPNSMMEVINGIRAYQVKHGSRRFNVHKELEKKMNMKLPNNVAKLANAYYVSLLSEATGTAGNANAEVEPLDRPSAGAEECHSPPPIAEAVTHGQPKPNGETTPPSKRSNYFRENEVTRTTCSYCTRTLIIDGKAQKCQRCGNVVHDLCGTSYRRFEVHDDNPSQGCLCTKCVVTESIFLCYKCGVSTNAAPYRVSIQTAGGDSKLTLLWNEKIRKERSSEAPPEKRKPKRVKLSAEEENQERLTKAKELQRWLTGIMSVKYVRSAEKYQVTSHIGDEEQQKMLHKSFVEDEILLMNKAFIKAVKMNRKIFHDVSNVVKENVILRNELWSGPSELYETYQKCMTGKEWTKICVHHKAKNVKELPEDLDAWEFVQDSSKFTHGQKQYYMSLQDEDKRKIEFVPKYFLFLWRVQISKDEMDVLMIDAWKKPNKWVTIQQGKSRYEISTPTNLLTTTYRNTFLQRSEATCVVTSLANAMFYINDQNAAYTLIRLKELSLLTTRRLQFVANEMTKLKYNVIQLRHFDILSNNSKWPTVCGLTGSDGGTTHAVTVCGDVLFDSNTKFALQLNRDNLNWCCGADGVNVQYVKVHLAYRFEFHVNRNLPKHFRNV